MRKRLLALITISLFLLTACQPTPENAPVVGKKDGKLEEMILHFQGNSQNYKFPEQWEQDFQNDEGNVTIEIDAQLDVPNVSAYPVVNAVPTTITKLDMEKMVKYFFGGKPVYDMPAGPNKSDLTKSILQYKYDVKTLLQSGKVHYTTHIFSAEEIQKELLKLQSIIEEYESKLASIEEIQRDTSSLDLVSEGEYKKITLVDTASGDYTSRFHIGIQDGNYSMRISFTLPDYSGYDDFEEPADNMPQGLDMTLEEAESLAKEMLADIGIEDAMRTKWFVGNYTGLDESITGVRNSEQCYVLYFCKPIAKIPITYFYDYEGASTFRPDGAEVYSYPWSPEVIEVYVNNNGVVHFKWQDSGTISGTINQNVQLLPWEDIKEKAIQQFRYKDIGLYHMGFDQENMTVEINKVKLGMMRVAKKDSLGEFMYIPVWDFFGNYIIEKPREDDYQVRACSMLTINAIDGSIIDRGLGY